MAHEVKDALINSGIGIIDAVIHVEPSNLNPFPGPGKK
jgi:hypothetical protein